MTETINRSSRRIGNKRTNGDEVLAPLQIMLGSPLLIVKSSRMVFRVVEVVRPRVNVSTQNLEDSPFAFQVKCVSKAWAMLIRSEELYKIRGDSGLAEPWMYALCESPRWGPWRVYDPAAQKWHLLRSKLPAFGRPPSFSWWVSLPKSRVLRQVRTFCAQ